MKPAARIEFFTRLQELNPHPKTELLYDSVFELLIAVMLSAQSTDVGVNKVTRKLFPLADNPEAMIELGLPAIKKAVSSLGLYNAKATNVLATCQLLVERHGSQVPRQRDALEALPGVGRKTANVVLNTAFGEPVMAVDTHIFRVANRTGLAKGKTVRQVEDKLQKAVPKQFMVDAHHWLILHGRYVCKARKPDCQNCVVRDLCTFKEKSA
ncbi:MAG: endonuclease III [Arenimonas sp.]|nr:endonuclease III [Arenimonas sp.]MBP7917010.1 endonuclease III [Arenimonas sp.]